MLFSYQRLDVSKTRVYIPERLAGSTRDRFVEESREHVSGGH